MKRLLKQTGSIYVHCDYHASHYIKVEMDKIFGYEHFIDQVIWNYGTPSGGRASGKKPVKAHDVILIYASEYGEHKYNRQHTPYSEKYISEWFRHRDGDGRAYRTRSRKGTIVRQYLDESPGVPLSNVWKDIMQLYGSAGWFKKLGTDERVGYPTQKPEALIARTIETSSDRGDIVLDAFSGGGGTGVVAQQLGRRWVMIDQSRVALAVTSERLKNDFATRELGDDPLPDFTTEHWGVYEADKLSEMHAPEFRQFVLHCYDARIPSEHDGIHGYKGSRARIPVWVGAPGRRARATAEDVNAFAESITKLERYQGDEGLRDGTMLAWGFRRDAQEAARLLRERDRLEVGLVRLNQIALDSPAFRAHVAGQSTERGDYSEFLTFAQPPLVEIAYKRIRGATYDFSADGSQVFNADAKLINVQWDFDHRDGAFRAERDTWFGKKKGKNAGPPLEAQHTFPHRGTFTVACKVQDDKGGEGMETIVVRVE